MTPQELSLAVENARRTVERLIADRDAFRRFDPRVAGRPATFNLAEAEAVYAAAIDAACRTLDTLVEAAARAIAPTGRPAEPSSDTEVTDGI